MSRENLRNTEQKSFSLSYQNVYVFVTNGTYENTIKYINDTLQDSQIFIMSENGFTHINNIITIHPTAREIYEIMKKYDNSKAA
jgi:hypothetical protein